ncbi:MAG: HEAT repeat domain-containing protein [Vicinamibacteria bacterium]
MNFFQALLGEARVAPAFEAVVVAVVVLAATATLACCLLLVHHAFTSVRRSHRRRLVESATRMLAPHIASAGPIADAAVSCRSRYGDWATSIVLREARGRAGEARAADLSTALGRMGEVARLTRLARSRQDWRRSKAVRELGQCGGDAAREVLLEAVRDRSPEVRRGAREGLLRDPRAGSVTAAIHAYLEDDGMGIAAKRTFYSQLARTRGEELRDLLRGGTLDRHEEKLALEAMGDVRDAGVGAVAHLRLSAPDPETRATAARVVGKLGDPRSAHALEPLLGDGAWYVRAAAAKAFDSMRPSPQSQRLLAGLLDDDFWWVRANAARALARQGDGGVDTLLAAVDGEDAYSRDAALAALGVAVLDRSARERLQERLARVTAKAHAAPLLRLLESVPEGAAA